jgi:hypothetical protein
MLVSAEAFFVHQQNTLECIYIVKQNRASWDRFQCMDTLFSPGLSSGLAEAGDAPLLRTLGRIPRADVADIR